MQHADVVHLVRAAQPFIPPLPLPHSRHQVHSDGNWGALLPRTMTMFLATHDIHDEAMGPTRFIPDTHVPACFPGGVWLPPTAANGVNEREHVWHGLAAGDATLMDSTTWHCGGGNTSDKKRVLLSISFTQSVAGLSADAPPCLRLGDFVDP